MKSETIPLPNGGELFKAFYPNGALAMEEYRLNNKRHREDGPAWLAWYDNGTVKLERYCLFGNLLTESEFLQKNLSQMKLVADAFNNATPNMALGLNF